MRSVLLCTLGALGLSAPVAAEPRIDGASAPFWQPCTAWVKNHPAKYGVTEEQGALVFHAEGKNTEMPWILELTRFQITGDERWLVVRYRATGMSTSPNVYFLHGEEGTYGGQNYARADALIVDDAWHTLAVDLLAIDPRESTRKLAVKVFVAGASARLTVQSIRFCEHLPASAQVAPLPSRRPARSLRVDWRAADKPLAQTGWTRSPAADFGAALEGTSMSFHVRGRGKGMRWLLPLREPIDLARLPHLSLRYRASGQIAGSSYAVWLGAKQTAGGGATIPVFAGDLKPDGRWHRLALKLTRTFTATQLAIGLDCDGDEARVTLDTLHFGDQPHRWNLAEILNYQTLGQPWPAGKGGLAAAPIEIRGGRPSPFLARRLELAQWFDADRVSVGGVPFEIVRDPGRIPQSPTAGFGRLSLALPAGVREVYLLVANTAPPSEPWGIDWRNPKPQEVLDVPEKVFYEIHYDAGPPDRVLPLDAATGQWGMTRGLSVSVVHPDPARRATQLAVHDRMQTASFAIVGATMHTGEPRVAEPNWDGLSAGLMFTAASSDPSTTQGATGGLSHGADRTPAGKLPAAPSHSDNHLGARAAVTAGALHAQFTSARGLRWSRLAAPDPAERLSCEPGPLFRVSVGGKPLPDESWNLVSAESSGAGRRFVLHQAATLLTATVDCLPDGESRLLLRMSLANRGEAAITATLHFPVLQGLRMGTAADTWYVCGKRGGIIHTADVSFREPLGERHPLQMDGFFSPRNGLALACLTHDTRAQHHFVNLAKTASGGQWSIEYVERDLAPGAAFTATEAALELRRGDWRAVFAAYTDWLKTWFRPAAPRKDWFEKSFAMASGSAHYAGHSGPADRGAIQPQIDVMLKHIGLCDYTHLFGWGASKTYGDWGDYDHYEELGGLEQFRDNIKAVQEKGIAVSLYLDAYLNCPQSRSAGSHALQWAMKRSDGSPQYVQQYRAYNECPYMKGWQDHLSRTYRRVKDELRPKILYIDEYGATDGRWICHAKDHGHNGYEIPYAGEVAMLERIRRSVGPEMVLYTEYPPAEVSRQYLDGSITYQALWSADQEALAPHFIDLPRFAFPDFKQLHIIYYVANRAGNWWLLKFPFFNGEVYRIGVPGLPGMDGPSLAFLRRAVEVQCAHRDAFASRNVHPLVRTEASGVFANLFAGPKENVWTLYNANGRSMRRPVLCVKHVEAATYRDGWNDQPLAPHVRDGRALVAVELDPKGVGCVVQRLP